VVATNVAETSVTIPDVVYVVDGGRVKETQYDAENGMQKLVECWTSKASGRQRRGRAGRTQPGEASLVHLKFVTTLTCSATSYILVGRNPTRCLDSQYQRSCVLRSNPSF